MFTPINKTKQTLPYLIFVWWKSNFFYRISKEIKEKKYGLGTLGIKVEKNLLPYNKHLCVCPSP